MGKPMEWWIRPEASYSREFVWPMDYKYMAGADDKIHVIEYSAYERIETENLVFRTSLLEASAKREESKEKIKSFLNWLRDGLDHISYSSEDRTQAAYLITAIDEFLEGLPF